MIQISAAAVLIYFQEGNAAAVAMVVSTVRVAEASSGRLQRTIQALPGIVSWITSSHKCTATTTISGMAIQCVVSGTNQQPGLFTSPGIIKPFKPGLTSQMTEI